MSVSGISSTSAYASIFFDTTSQQRSAQTLGGQSGGDTVSFSSEAMEMYQASKAEQQATASAEASEENLTSNGLQDSAEGEESLTGQAVSGGMKGGKGKPSGQSSEEDDDDDDDDTTTSWYDDWFESMYGDSTAAEDSMFTSLLEETK